MPKFRSHLVSHGNAWLNFFVAVAVTLLLMHVGLNNKAVLIPEKLAQLALSQVAAHLVVMARDLDAKCETWLRIGFAIAVALAG